MVRLPTGAASIDLLDKAKIRRLAIRCGASWYKYANVDKGREASNGSLYVVTGCDKANAFQLASWSEGEVSLTFTATKMGGGGVSYSYSDETYNPATIRVGPRTLSQEQNQCIFLRGFKIAIREAPMARLRGSVSLNSITDSKASQILRPSGGGGIPYGDNRRWPPSSSVSGGGSSAGSSGSSSPRSASNKESDSTCHDEVSVEIVPAASEARSSIVAASLYLILLPALSSFETDTGSATQ
jgi:hypothetical protein